MICNSARMNRRIWVSLLILMTLILANRSYAEITDSPFGINTEEWFDVVKEVDLVSIDQIGVKYLRFTFCWSQIEPEKNVFKWVQFTFDTDATVRKLKEVDINVLGVLGSLRKGNPHWAQDPECRDDPLNEAGGCIPVDFSDYTNFVREVVRRYKPGGILAQNEGWGDEYGIRHWQILNEPIWPSEWRGTPEEYVELLRLSYEAIKEEDPEAKVLNGPIMPTAKMTHMLYNLGAKDYFDIMAFHFYPYPESAYRSHAWGLKGVGEMKGVMNDFNDGNKPIWVTEGGWGDDTNEKLQCRYMIKFFVILLADGMEKVFWFAVENYPTVWSGIIKEERELRPEWTPFLKSVTMKLAYYTYRLMTEKLEGSDWGNVKAIIEDANDCVYAYRFVKNGNSIYVAWWDYWEEEMRESLADELRSRGIPDSLISSTVEVMRDATSLEEGAQKIGEIGLTDDQIGKVRGLYNRGLYKKIRRAAVLQDVKAKKTISLPVDFTGNALITYAVPDAKKGADLHSNEYPTFFPTQIVPVVNGEITLQLGEDPVFLEPITIHTDTMAPAKITDLAASDPKADSITLTWTAPGDDGNIGTATSYDIRYFTSPIAEGNWAEAIQCISESIPKSAGTKETFTVTGLQPGIIYYFAIKAQDEAGNTSEISNTVETHSATPWDVNDDGIVDIFDLIIVGKHFGEEPPKERKADVNGDGTVDMLDLAVVAKHFGEKGATSAATMTSARIAWERKKTIQLRQGRTAEVKFTAHRAGHSAGFSENV